MIERNRLVAEVDERIRVACPNLFIDHREDLRNWLAIFERKRQYYEAHKKYADAISPHSPEQSDWFDMYWSRLEVADEQAKKTLSLHAHQTELFVNEAKASTSLTAAEINFLTFDHWRDWVIDNYKTTPDIVVDHTRERFAALLKEWRRP